MAGFESPTDLTFNRGPIADPEAFARDAGAGSWPVVPDMVLARAEADGAPFVGSDDLKAWVAQGLDELS